MKALSIANFVSQLVIIGSVYAIAFRTSVLFGGLTLIGHVSYELTDLLLKKEMYKQLERERKAYYDNNVGNVTQKGNC